MAIEPKQPLQSHDDFMKRADELLREIDLETKSFVVKSDAALVQLRETIEEEEESARTLGRDVKKIEREGLGALNKLLRKHGSK